MMHFNKQKTIYVAKIVAYFVLHIPVTLLFMGLYLSYSYYPLNIGSSLGESNRLSEGILVLCLLLVVVRAVMTARKRRWHYIIINSLAPFALYGSLVFAFFSSKAIVMFMFLAITVSVLALLLLFDGKSKGKHHFKKRIFSIPIIVTNVFILVFSWTAIIPVFSNVIDIGYISIEYNKDIAVNKRIEADRMKDLRKEFEKDFEQLTVEDKLRIATYISEIESEYYGIKNKPVIAAKMLDTTAYAATSYDENTITYNKTYLDMYDKEVFLQSMLHEMSHVYSNNLIRMYMTQIKNGEYEDLKIFDETKQFILNSGSYIEPRSGMAEYKAQFTEEFAARAAKERYAYYKKALGKELLGEYPK